ncbi:unnamed protein product, partial [Ilex paraguariensis]
ENTSVRINGGNGVESFCGKSGSISFVGSSLVLQLMASSVMRSSQKLLPHLLLISSSISDLQHFCLFTDRVQKPYLQFSPKRWGLITGLKGYLTSAFFTMGFKVFAPLVAIFVTWPVLGLPALVSVAPLLVGYLAQYVFEKLLDKQGSSCWPLVPIIFEVYRLYQLSKATHFIEKLMFAMRGATLSPEVLERNGALVAMIVTFQVLGVICLWSLLTFLQRLFPSRPVAEKY